MKKTNFLILIWSIIVLISCENDKKISKENVNNLESYNLKGKVKLVKEYNFIVQDSSETTNMNLIVDTEEYQFNEKGILTAYKQLLRGGLESNTEYISNENGNTILEVTNAQNGNVIKETSFEYDAFGHTKFKKTKLNGSENGFTKYDWFQDKSYGIKRESVYNFDTSHYERIEEDTLGNIIKCTTFERGKAISVYTYKTNKVTSEMKSEYPDGITKNGFSIYKFNLKGEVILQQDFDNKNVLIKTVYYDFDKNNNEIATGSIIEGIKKPTRITSYKYDSIGNWINKETTKYFENSKIIISNDRSIEYYQD